MMDPLIFYFLKKAQDKETFLVPAIEKEVVRKINPNTNREKNFKKTKHVETDIKPEDRTIRNIPSFSDGKPKVHFVKWLGIKGQKLRPESKVNSFGWGADGKCYGWSHRAAYGFAVGDTVKPGTCGFDGSKPKTLKTKEEVEQMAKDFARSIS